MVDHIFDDHFFHVYVEAQQADKRKLMKEFLIFRISIFEYFSGAFEPAHEIFFQVTDLSLFHTENFLIDISHIFLSHGFKIFLRDRCEQSLDIIDGKNILEIVNKNQHQHMFFGITFLLRRGKEQIESLKKDLLRKYKTAQDTFGDADEEDQANLKRFSFICLLSFDVYVKKMMIEHIIDGMNPEPEHNSKKKK